MVLLRTLLRGSRVLGGGALSLLLSAPKNTQTPSFCSPFLSFVHKSPSKFVANDTSDLLHHSSPHFIAFPKFGTSSYASLDPLGKEIAKPNSVSSDAEIEILLKADMEKLVEEIIEFINAEKQDNERLARKWARPAEVFKALIDPNMKRGFKTYKYAIRQMLEIHQLVGEKKKVSEEWKDRVLGTLMNVSDRTGWPMSTYKILRPETGFGIEVKISPKKSVIQNVIDKFVKGSFSEQIDEFNSKDIASLQGELELARKHLSLIILKSEEVGLRLEYKIDELRNKLKIIRGIEKRGDYLYLGVILVVIYALIFYPVVD